MPDPNETNNLPPQEGEQPSLLGSNPPPQDPPAGDPPVWQEYVPDPAKSAEENEAAKAEHDKAKPQDPPADDKGKKKDDEFVPLKDDDIKMPEGMEELPEAKGEFLGILNNRDLTPAQQAQALIDLQAKVMKDASERVSSLFAQQQTEWVEEIKKDAEFGGPKLEENLGQIGKLIDQYGGQEAAELRQVFDLTGAGNNPKMIRFLSRIAKDLGEGKPLAGTPGTGEIKSEADLAARMYPSMKS